VIPSNVGFLVRQIDGSTYATANVNEMELGHECLLKTTPTDGAIHREYPVLFGSGAANFSLSVDKDGTGMYAILYANCDEGTAASFRLTATLMNRGGVFLSAGDIPLPTAYGLLGAAFLAAAAVWVAVVRAHRATAHAIHWLMALLCLVKVSLVCLSVTRRMKGGSQGGRDDGRTERGGKGREGGTRNERDREVRINIGLAA
jgi:hypothetical protein